MDKKKLKTIKIIKKHFIQVRVTEKQKEDLRKEAKDSGKTICDIVRERVFRIKRKYLKFAPELIPFLKSGEKTTTWRLPDEKELQINDVLDCINSKTNEVFGRAKIINIKKTTIENLTEEDKQGHEEYNDLDEILKTMYQYYKEYITKKDVIEVIKFKYWNIGDRLIE